MVVCGLSLPQELSNILFETFSAGPKRTHKESSWEGYAQKVWKMHRGQFLLSNPVLPVATGVDL